MVCWWMKTTQSSGDFLGSTSTADSRKHGWARSSLPSGPVAACIPFPARRAERCRRRRRRTGLGEPALGRLRPASGSRRPRSRSGSSARPGPVSGRV